MQNEVVVAALQELLLQDPERKLRAEAVVEAAANPLSPLHAYFEWDDRKAGHEYRLWQARTLLCRVEVVNPEAMEQKPVPVFVSLMEDRVQKGGGYRAVPDVLTSADLRASLMRTALAELAAWTRRYSMLTELVQSVAEAAQLPLPAMVAHMRAAEAAKQAEVPLAPAASEPPAAPPQTQAKGRSAPAETTRKRPRRRLAGV